VRWRAGRLEARPKCGVPVGLVVDSLVNGHELLCHVPVGNRHRSGGPAARRPRRIEEAADRVRRDRLGEFRKSTLGHPARADQPVTLAVVSCLRLVNVVQEGGDRDEVRIDLNAGSREQPCRLSGDPTDASRVGDDSIREVEGGKQQLGLGGGRNGHASMLPAGRLAVIARATTGRHGSVPMRLMTR